MAILESREEILSYNSDNLEGVGVEMFPKVNGLKPMSASVLRVIGGDAFLAERFSMRPMWRADLEELLGGEDRHFRYYLTQVTA